MALRRPDEPAARAGNARFEIHFEKTRSRRGPPLMPVLAELQTDEAAAAAGAGGRPRAAGSSARRRCSTAASARARRRSARHRPQPALPAKAEARARGLLTPGREP